MKENGPNLIENFFFYFSVDSGGGGGGGLLKTDDLNADNSTKRFLDKINMLLDIYAPLKSVAPLNLKFKSNHWVTLGLQKSISVKNKLLTDLLY